MSKTVHLGYEVGTGKHVSIQILHTVITGQTQLAGKTTTFEALIASPARTPLARLAGRHGQLLYVCRQD